MFPGLGNLNPKKMQGMMKQMGIQQDEIPAEKVTIQTPDKNIIINNPSVIKIKMQGQESYQITGQAQEEPSQPTEQDIKLVMEKTSCTKEQAKSTLEKTQDIAEAIMQLSE